MNRRDFLKLFGTGVAVTAAGIIVPELVKPERRFWQVGAALGGKRLAYEDPWMYSSHGFTYAADEHLYSVDVRLPNGHAYTFAASDLFELSTAVFDNSGRIVSARFNETL